MTGSGGRASAAAKPRAPKTAGGVVVAQSLAEEPEPEAEPERPAARKAPAPEKEPDAAQVKADAEEVAARGLQMAAEGLTPANSVTLKGKRFRVAASIAGIALWKFAAVADAGVSTADFRAMSAMYAMMRDCIDQGTPPCGQCEECLTQPGVPNPACPEYDAGEWGRFEEHALVSKASPDELFAAVQEATQIITARPTRQP